MPVCYGRNFGAVQEEWSLLRSGHSLLIGSLGPITNPLGTKALASGARRS